MKKVVCWKVLKLNATFDEALKMYTNQDYDHPVSINCQSTGKIFYPEEKIKLNQLQISLDDCSRNWTIRVPDDQREEKTKKLQNIVKEANFLQLTHNQIDYMDIDKIMSYIYNHYLKNEDTAYRVIKWFCENKVFKKS